MITTSEDHLLRRKNPYKTWPSHEGVPGSWIVANVPFRNFLISVANEWLDVSIMLPKFLFINNQHTQRSVPQHSSPHLALDLLVRMFSSNCITSVFWIFFHGDFSRFFQEGMDVKEEAFLWFFQMCRNCGYRNVKTQGSYYVCMGVFFRILRMMTFYTPKPWVCSPGKTVVLMLPT